MRKTFSAILAAGLLAFAGYSQPVTINTNTSPPTLQGPLISVFSSLAEATNWTVAPFFTVGHTEKGQRYGGGLAAVYNLTESVGTMLRFDALDGDFSMVSANLQLSLPVTIASNVTTTFFGFSGIATSLSGRGEENGTIQGVFGAGVDLKFPKLSKHWSIAFDVEDWTGLPGPQYRFTPFVWKF